MPDTHRLLRSGTMANSRPVIDQRAAEQMNLNVLRRIDPQIEELLASAGHVALYDFDIPSKRWSRKDVEGSLFLVKRRSQPRFQFVILNKKSAVATDNFVEDVHGGFQCEVQKPYVLYRNRVNEVGVAAQNVFAFPYWWCRTRKSKLCH